jgi:hypothetical protein
MDTELKREIDELKRQNSELTKKVDALYSTAGFPDTVLETLQRKGFVRIDQVLETNYYTTEERFAKYYYLFSKIDNKNVVFPTTAGQEFIKIQSVSASANTFTSNNHGLITNDLLTLWSTTTPPAPLKNGGKYYIQSPTINTFKLTDVFSSVYNNSTTYNIGDVVSYQGSVYSCKTTSTGNVPTNTTYWDNIDINITDVGTGLHFLERVNIIF